MKRILLPLTLVVAVAAQAQIINNPKAKVDPKNNKVSNPVVEKPKPKPANLMSREELRACLDLEDGNNKEAQAIKTEQASFKANEEKVKAERVANEAEDAALSQQVQGVKAEQQALMAEHAALVAEGPKMKEADFKARNTAFEARRAAFNDSLQKAKNDETARNAKRKSYDANVDALRAQFAALEERTEKYFDSNDKWKAQCQNKVYDENDLKAVRADKAAGK